MSYQQMFETYSGDTGRMQMCVRQQALIYAADGRPDIRSLADAVVAGRMEDVFAVIAAACVGPNWSSLDDDQALLAAVQGAWPVVAAARYGQG